MTSGAANAARAGAGGGGDAAPAPAGAAGPFAFDGRTAFVTGAAQGLGGAIAQAFHGMGANVVIADVDRDGAARLGERLDADGATAQALSVDLRDSDAACAAFDAAVSRWGQVDVLVNNAAITHVVSPWQLQTEQWDEALDVNLRATFVLSREAGRHMRERGSGRIVNIASLAGQAARPTGIHYAASKAGMIALTRVFAAELAPHGVTVNAVSPALVDTPMVRAVSEEKRRELVDAVPVGRLCQPDEVATLVAYLASDHAGFITGATYDINGGALMR